MTRDEKVKGVRRLVELAETNCDLPVASQLAEYWKMRLRQEESTRTHHGGEIERSLNDSYFIYQTIIDQFDQLPDCFTSEDVKALDRSVSMFSGKKICSVLSGMSARNELIETGKKDRKKRKIFQKPIDI